MSKKSKHGRGKHPHNRKRDRTRQFQPSAPVVPPVAGDISRAAAPNVAAPIVTAPGVAAAPMPQVQVPRKAAATAAVPIRHETLISELKNIGILVGVIVVILIVLYIFLK